MADPGELGPSTTPAATAPSTPPAPALGGREAPRERPTHDSYEAKRAAQDQRRLEQATGGPRNKAPVAPPTPAQPPVSAAAGERRIKVGDGEFSEAEITAAIEHKAAREARAARFRTDARAERHSSGDKCREREAWSERDRSR